MTVDCPALQPAVIETKQQRWRKRNPDRHRTYMRQYMRKRRLIEGEVVDE